MGSAKRRFKIVEGDLIRKVQQTDPRRQFDLVGSQYIITAETDVKQVTRRDPRRVSVVVFRAIGRNA